MGTLPRNEVEARAGIESLDRLLAERQALVDLAAPLAARYGPFGVWDSRRKQVLAECSLDVRARSEKMTEAHIDARARTHPRYITFLESSESDKAEWLRLDNAIQSVNERIQRDQALLRFVTQELTLHR